MPTVNNFFHVSHRLLHYDDRVLDLVSQWKRFQGEDDTGGEFIKFVYKVGIFVLLSSVIFIAILMISLSLLQY